MSTSAFFPLLVPPAAPAEGAAAPSAAGASAEPAGPATVTKQLFSTPFGGQSAPLAVVAGRGWRFPSSRRYLWDRSAAGPAVALDGRDFVPEVEVAVSALAPSAGGAVAGHAPLHAEYSVAPNHKVRLQLRSEDKLAALHSSVHRDIVTVSCRLDMAAPSHPKLGSGMDAVTQERLQRAFQRSMDTASAASVSHLFAVDLRLTQRAPRSAADANGEAGSPGGSSRQLTGVLLAPAAQVLLTPLYSKRLADVPLARSLTAAPAGGSPSASAQAPVQLRSGYLTMDQARNLVPLLTDDSTVRLLLRIGCPPLIVLCNSFCCVPFILLEHAFWLPSDRKAD